LKGPIKSMSIFFHVDFGISTGCISAGMILVFLLLF
jgi:hypothetical protein